MESLSGQKREPASGEQRRDGEVLLRDERDDERGHAH